MEDLMKKKAKKIGCAAIGIFFPIFIVFLFIAMLIGPIHDVIPVTTSGDAVNESRPGDFWEKLTNFLTFKGWQTDRDYVQRSFYKYVENTYNGWKQMKGNPMLDMALIVSTLLYNKDFEGMYDKLYDDLDERDEDEQFDRERPNALTLKQAKKHIDDLSRAMLEQICFIENGNLVCYWYINKEQYKEYVINGGRYNNNKEYEEGYIYEELPDLFGYLSPGAYNEKQGDSGAYQYRKEEIYREMEDRKSLYVEFLSQIWDDDYYLQGLPNSDVVFCGENCDKITVSGEYAGTYSLEEYVAGVLSKEVPSTYDPEALKAMAIAARTYALVKTNNGKIPIGNSSASQNFAPTNNITFIQAAQSTAGMVLTYDGEMFLSEYASFPQHNRGEGNYFCSVTCSGGTCTTPLLRLPKNEIVNFSIPESAIPGDPMKQKGHCRGMSQIGANYLASYQQLSYEAILKYFYAEGVEIKKMSTVKVNGKPLGNTSIFAESIFPIGDTLRTKACYSAGYYYSKNKYHGAIDLSCRSLGYAAEGRCADSVFDTQIPIVASHSGTVTAIHSGDRCNRINSTPVLKYDPKCRGNYITIAITDPSSPFVGYRFIYYHFATVSPNLSVGSKVEQGQVIGTMGNTGNSTAAHLHFQIQTSAGDDINLDSIIAKYCNENGLK